ncbi:site-specific integrase [Rhodocyclus gracilis]|nr:site-specific integrase [Rhodocyclus gracilis]
MAYPSGMEKHGNRWRIKKRTPRGLQAHYPGQLWHRFSTDEPHKKAAAALIRRWEADLEEEFQRIRDTGSRHLQELPPEQIQALAAAHRADCLRIHEDITEQGFGVFEGSTFKADFEESARRRLEELRNAGASSDYSLMGGYAALLLRRHKLPLAEGSPSWLKLCRALWMAEREIMEAALTRGAGGWVDTPAPPSAALFSKETPATPGVPLLSALITKFLGEQDTSAPMFKKYRPTLELFLEYMTDRPGHAIKQREIDDFFTFLCRLPPHWKKEQRQGLTVREMATREWPKLMHRNTILKTYKAAFRPFLAWCQRKYHDETPPFPQGLTTDGIKYSGTRTETERKQRALTHIELQRLFNGPEFAAFAADPSQEHRYWLPLIGLYTGARVNEVCQLNPQCDIREQDGIWCFHFTEDTETDERVDKSVKNASSHRHVPIHPRLLALGFVDYAKRMRAAGHVLLFPKWSPKAGKASGKAREWFSEWLAEIGLRDETLGGCVLGFHCFRSTLMTAAQTIRALPWPIEHITGHETTGNGESRTSKGYKKRELPLAEKAAILEMIHFDIEPPMLRKVAPVGQ